MSAEVLTADERAALDDMSALYGGIGAKLLRLYDAALARAEKAERNMNAIGESWRLPCERAESRLAEATALLVEIREECDRECSPTDSFERIAKLIAAAELETLRAASACDHSGIGLPGCTLCDPRLSATPAQAAETEHDESDDSELATAQDIALAEGLRANAAESALRECRAELERTRADVLLRNKRMIEARAERDTALARITELEPWPSRAGTLAADLCKAEDRIAELEAECGKAGEFEAQQAKERAKLQARIAGLEFALGVSAGQSRYGQTRIARAVAAFGECPKTYLDNPAFLRGLEALR